jgi:hypothetical protein
MRHVSAALLEHFARQSGRKSGRTFQTSRSAAAERWKSLLSR